MADSQLDFDKLVELLRKMGHDIRAPLGSIISTSDMLAEGVYEPLSSKQSRANERVRRNSRRVLTILDDFMTYVKAEAGQMNLPDAPFDPRASLSRCCEVVKAAADEKGLNLRLTTGDNVPAQIIGNEEAVSRIILALLWNAIAFTSTGTIQIHANRSKDNYWCITVQDSGMGIAVTDIPHLFEPFWRGEARPQVPTAGAGLGLSVSSALARVMKGRLFLQQTGVEGSTFCLELPCSP